MVGNSLGGSLQAGIYTDGPQDTPCFQQLLGDKSDLNLSFSYTWLGTSSDVRQQLFFMPDRRVKNLFKKYHVIIIEHHRDLDNVTLLIDKFKEIAPQTPLVFVGHAPSPVQLTEWIEVGMDGYLLEQQTAAEIDEAVFQLLESRVPAIDRGLMAVLVEGVRLKARKVIHSGKKMSAVQQSICTLLVQGHTYNEIGQELGIKLDKVRYHIQQIYQKHNVNKGTQLIRLLKGL